MLKVIPPDKIKLKQHGIIRVTLPVLLICDVPLNRPTAYLAEFPFGRLAEHNEVTVLQYAELAEPSDDESLPNRVSKTNNVAKMIEWSETVCAVIKMGEADGSEQVCVEFGYDYDGYQLLCAFQIALAKNDVGDYVLTDKPTVKKTLDDFFEALESKVRQAKKTDELPSLLRQLFP